HCGTSISSQARCTGWLRSVESPSIVVTDLPATDSTGTEHERVGAPSMCTVHAPHNALPQPYFVPVIPSVSRRTHNSGVSPATSTSCARPFTVSLIMSIPLEPAYVL